MAEDGGSFADVMARLGVGDEAAAREVFRRFAGRLIARARAHLDGQLRQRVDPEDVVQSVYKSFFLRQAEGQFQLAGWGDLWDLLVVITLRKCANQAQYHRRECRDISREIPLGGEEADPGRQVIDREPTPEEAVILAETLEELLGEFDPSGREIIQLSLQGYTSQEIKELLGRAERSVRRVRERFRENLERRVGAG